MAFLTHAICAFQLKSICDVAASKLDFLFVGLYRCCFYFRSLQCTSISVTHMYIYHIRLFTQYIDCITSNLPPLLFIMLLKPLVDIRRVSSGILNQTMTLPNLMTLSWEKNISLNWTCNWFNLFQTWIIISPRQLDVGDNMDCTPSHSSSTLAEMI
jgi:hypothetical protein